MCRRLVVFEAATGGVTQCNIASGTVSLYWNVPTGTPHPEDTDEYTRGVLAQRPNWLDADIQQSPTTSHSEVFDVAAQLPTPHKLHTLNVASGSLILTRKNICIYRVKVENSKWVHGDQGELGCGSHAAGLAVART